MSPNQFAGFRNQLVGSHSRAQVFVYWGGKVLVKNFFLKIVFIYFLREGKGGRKKGRETLM